MRLRIAAIAGAGAGSSWGLFKFRGKLDMKILAKMVATVLGVQALVSVDAALASQYVTNGGFELSSYTSSQVFFGANTPATDWTSGGSWVIFCTAANTRCDDSALYGYLAPPVPLSPQGGNFMAFDGDPSFSAPFTQTISGLTVGASYTLSFYMAGAQECCANSPTTESMTVTLGSETYTTPTINTPADGFSPWMLYSTTFTYSGGGDVLTFLAAGAPSGEPPYALLDGVSLTSGGVPELSTWAMIIVGFAGVCFAARVRRRAIAVAA